MLHAPTRRRERILLYGPSGAGKSTAWLSVAEWIKRTRSPAQMHVLDTDRTWDDMAPYDGHLDATVTAYPCDDWTPIREAIRTLEKIDASEDDWLVTDMASRVWDRVQEKYFEQAYGKDLDEFYAIGELSKRAEAISGPHGVNWQAINKMYATYSRLLMTRWPGHVLSCTPAANMREDISSDQKTIVQYPEFGRIGMRPQGQKDLAGQHRTILFMQQAPSGWKMTTGKERNPPGLGDGDEGFRGYVEGEDVKDFVRTYLMSVGGWKL